MVSDPRLWCEAALRLPVCAPWVLWKGHAGLLQRGGAGEEARTDMSMAACHIYEGILPFFQGLSCVLMCSYTCECKSLILS